MKYELQTIPLWDALHKESECPVCLLMNEAEKDGLSYYLESSVMNPETRVEVNKRGFCHHHWSKLLETRKAHPLSLITHTHFEKLITEYEKSFKKGTLFQKPKRGCLICSFMRERLNRYLFTIIKLWESDELFKKAFLESKGVCLYHLPSLLEMGKKVLRKREAEKFFSDLNSLTLSNMRRLEADLLWMTQKYKAENFDKPWNNCEDAHQRVIEKISGSGHLYEES